MVRPLLARIALKRPEGNRCRSSQLSEVRRKPEHAALVWSNAPVITGAHDTGPLIQSKNRFYLAIPTSAGCKSMRGSR
jgi:hypothetical protein